MPELGVTRAQILNELNMSLHGNLGAYGAVIGNACREDPEFVARLIAYDFLNGQIKDSKIALPVITLASCDFPDELIENSLAHLVMQPPRELAKALEFSITSGTPARRQRKLEAVIRRYLTFKESEPGKWNRVAARHRRSLKSLYAKTHAPMADWASKILFGNQYAPGSIFADIALLSQMAPAQVAATIQKWHLSPLVVSGAMAGAKAKQSDAAVVAATMDQMSDTETVTRAASLERRGIGKDAVLKEKFRQKVSRATKSKKATLKTSVAAEEVEDESLKTMLRELQERQIQAQKDAGRGIDGNWLVIADKSGSQTLSIELGKSVAAAVAKFVSGKVWLAFCDVTVSGYDVTGQSLEQIKGRTKYVNANGGTSYGVGLDWAAKHNLDGIALIGDGAENTPSFFANVYTAYRHSAKKEPPVYLYRTASTESAQNCLAFKSRMDASGIPFTEFDLTSGRVDYFSIPNIVQSMNASRFGVVDRVMACPLITLDRVLPQLVAAGR